VVAYRFCRPDDVPRLVDAVNSCSRPHCPGWSEITVESFRREMKVLDVWPSNSMVAMMGEEPGAVLIGTKRAREVLVHRVAVAPRYQRQGHGRHLLTSLSQKLAVLGPPRLVAEVLEERRGVGAFLTAVGYRQEAEWVDWRRPRPPTTAPPAELFAPVTVSELDRAGRLDAAAPRAWARQPETLRNRAAELTGVALASPDGWAAWALAAHGGEELEALAWGAVETARPEALLGPLFGHLQHRFGLPLSLPRVAPEELAGDSLAALGFTPGARTRLYAAEAQPA
jgi:GNAT superfamily N-acetyltransferase